MRIGRSLRDASYEGGPTKDEAYGIVQPEGELKIWAVDGKPAYNKESETFTAPGNDGATGTAGCYDVRQSLGPITAANFDQASPVNIGTLIPSALPISPPISSAASASGP